MFDTGESALFTISPQDWEGVRQTSRGHQQVEGMGSLGGSLGGKAKSRPQLRVELKKLKIGDIPFGRVDSVVRAVAPSLLGASVLDHFIVTLDYHLNTAYFDRFAERAKVGSSFGFGMDFEQDPTISLVWEGSPAAKADLKVGESVVAINDETIQSNCPSLKRTMKILAEENSVQLDLQNRKLTLTRWSNL